MAIKYQCRGKNLVILLYKKGSRKNPSNYREISILNRLFVRIIHDELREPQSTLLAKV